MYLTNFEKLNVRWWPKEQNHIQTPTYAHNHDHFIIYNGDFDISELDIANQLKIDYDYLKRMLLNMGGHYVNSRISWDTQEEAEAAIIAIKLLRK